MFAARSIVFTWRNQPAHDTNAPMRVSWLSLLFGVLAAVGTAAAQTPAFESEPIFAPEPVHNHASSIVELPDGGLLACWYHGSGESDADDVRIEGARFSKDGGWSKRFPLYDTPGFPDMNPVLFVDSAKRLWLFWGVLVANDLHTSLLKYLRADDAGRTGPPQWEWSSEILLKPEKLDVRTAQYLYQTGQDFSLAGIRLLTHARDKYFSRMGWLTRNHPIELPSGRILLPLYSDGYGFGLVAMSDDHGASWQASEPIVGGNAVQPSLLRRRNGELVAFLRDNGPPPKRVLISTSSDDGMSWSIATDTDIPNPGSSLEALVLRDGRWILVYNDTEQARNSLAVSMSDDEGRSWKWTRHIEKAPTGSFHYPSVIQASDGDIHVTYSRNTFGNPELEAIQHARFNEAWIEAGDD